MRSQLKRIEALESKAVMHGVVSRQSSVFGVYDADRGLVTCRVIGGDEIDAEPDLSIPEKMQWFLYPSRYKTAYGGRGSAKTRTIASILVERARCAFERILCCREIMKSIQDSSWQEIVDEINRRSLEDEFSITDKKITHKETGSSFGFEGLYRNQTKIKGYAGATIAWVEEAENVSLRSWDYLVNTIRAKDSEIWTSFNPAKPEDPTYTERVEPYIPSLVSGVYVDWDANPFERVTVVNINWRDNPWFPDELDGERRKLMERDYDRYLWVYEGEFYDRKEAQVFSGKWEVKEFEPHHKLWNGPYNGLDFGFSQDPTAGVRVWIHDECLWIEREAVKQHLELDDTAEFLMDRLPEIEKQSVRADNARPESISYLSRKGLPRIVGCDKGKGSVEDGISFIKSFKRIYIHPRCDNAIYEARNYQYKTDRITDEVLDVILDKDNHCWDAIRYALEPAMKNENVNWAGLL